MATTRKPNLANLAMEVNIEKRLIEATIKYNHAMREFGEQLSHFNAHLLQRIAEWRCSSGVDRRTLHITYSS